MAKFKKGRRKTEYVRATALFPVDSGYLPKGAKSSFRGRASGEFRDQVAEVVEKAMENDLDIAFTVTRWKGEENPVLSIGVVEPRESNGRKGGKRRKRRDDDDERDERDEEDDEGEDEESEDDGEDVDL